MRDTIERQLANPDVQVIITTGGTGITSRDSTYEAVCGLLQKQLDGFGELFRMLSYEQIGSAAMMSRAFAGTSPDASSSRCRVPKRPSGSRWRS